MSCVRCTVCVQHSVAASAPAPPPAIPAAPPPAAADPWDVLLGELDDAAEFIDLGHLMITLLDRGGGP
jgi:hypothetical protein